MDLTIRIQITYDELQNACEALAYLSDYHVYTREAKVTKSVLNLLSVKLLKKLIAKKHQQQPFKLKLEYYEAHTLERYLLMHNITYNNYYVQRLTDKLNQILE